MHDHNAQFVIALRLGPESYAAPFRDANREDGVSQLNLKLPLARVLILFILTLGSPPIPPLNERLLVFPCTWIPR